MRVAGKRAHDHDLPPSHQGQAFDPASHCRLAPQPFDGRGMDTSGPLRRTQLTHQAAGPGDASEFLVQFLQPQVGEPVDGRLRRDREHLVPVDDVQQT